MLYVGLSEVNADEIRRAHAITPISAVELEWSLFTRDVEVRGRKGVRVGGRGLRRHYSQHV